MTSFQCADIHGDFTQTPAAYLSDDHGLPIDEGKDSDKVDSEFHLANETFDGTPRSNHSKSSSSDVISLIPRKQFGHRPKSGKPSTPKASSRQMQQISSIPLPVKISGPIKIPPLIKNMRSTSRSSSMTTSRVSGVANKHTLEIQFINKNKRYLQMKKDMVDKQRPVLDLYQSLIQIKKKLEELGKSVKLEDIKLITYEEYTKPADMLGDGEPVSMEIVTGMQHSIEEIPKTLIDICKNLLSRRALIVELLESVTKSEVDVSEVSDKIESLKNEGQQLQHSLDAVITEHQTKINVLVGNWQKLLNDKQSHDTDNKIEELENKLEDQERLTQESNNIIHELYQKMEDRKLAYDRSYAELNGVIQALKEQIKKLEHDLENEKKATVDFKTRNNTNAQNLKSMRARITELENQKITVESSNAEMQKKIKLLQDQIKHKEVSWCREKEELNKSLKHQENLLQKLTADKNQFETRFKSIRNEKDSTEAKLQSTISLLKDEVNKTNSQLKNITSERNAALKNCEKFENYIARMRTECAETMNKVSYSIEWGKDVSKNPAAENYIQEIAKDLRIRELQDRINYLEKEKTEYYEKEREQKIEPTTTLVPQQMQQISISKYELLLEESENILKEKSTEIEKLRSEIRHLNVRQMALEEQHIKCPTHELKRMVEESQRRLYEVMKRSMESEHTVEKYVDVIEKQAQQLNEMENLLRYRENMANMLKTSRDDLVQEKESLMRYSQEIRHLLAEVTKQGKIKECLSRELQEKVYLRERQIIELKELVHKLEVNLVITNEKRFKLQETVGILEKRLSTNKNDTDQETEISNQYNNQSLCCDNSISQCRVNDYNSSIPLQSQNLQSLNDFDRHDGHSIMSNMNKNGTLEELSICKKCSGRVSKHSSPTKFRKMSNRKIGNLNLSIFKDTISNHLNCQHKVNSRSLISLSLQTVDFLKTRLNYLTSVNMLSPESTDILSTQRQEDYETCATQTTTHKIVSQDNVGKILKLSAKRYKYLQNQAIESYEDLTKLVKLAVTQKGVLKK